MNIGTLLLTTALMSNVLTASTDADRAQAVRYALHFDVDDFASPVASEIELQLRPADRDGAFIAWRVEQVVVTEFDADGVPARQWSRVDPVIDTPDGLWWVEHYDPLKPHPAEFTLMPHVSGLARSQDADLPGLAFALRARPTEPSTDDLPAPAALLSYVLLAEDDSEPEVGEDEPVEVDLPEDPG